MKENWMEKLITLLNEHLKTFDTETNKTLKVFAFEEATKSFLAENGTSYRQERVISKRFKFIQRLVDNKKIDTQKFREKAKFLILSNSIKYYEFLLMELSIQKKPINFLLGILK